MEQINLPGIHSETLVPLLKGLWTFDHQKKKNVVKGNFERDVNQKVRVNYSVDFWVFRQNELNSGIITFDWSTILFVMKIENIIIY